MPAGCLAATKVHPEQMPRSEHHSGFSLLRPIWVGFGLHRNKSIATVPAHCLLSSHLQFPGGSSISTRMHSSRPLQHHAPMNCRYVAHHGVDGVLIEQNSWPKNAEMCGDAGYGESIWFCSMQPNPSLLVTLTDARCTAFPADKHASVHSAKSAADPGPSRYIRAAPNLFVAAAEGHDLNASSASAEVKPPQPALSWLHGSNKQVS